MDREQMQKRYDELYQKTMEDECEFIEEEEYERVELYYALSGKKPIGIDLGDIIVEMYGSDESHTTIHPPKKKQ